MVRRKQPSPTSLLPGVRRQVNSRKHPHTASKIICSKAPRPLIDPDNPVSKGAMRRKKLKWRAGTVALREIRKQQKSTNLLIERAPFQRVVREIIQDVHTTSGDDMMRISALAMEAIQVAGEAYLIDFLQLAGSLGIHAGRVTLMRKDCHAAKNFLTNGKL